MFQGIAPKIRYCDPEFFRFELRLHWQYLALRFTEFNNQLIKVFTNYSVAMQKAAKSMRRVFQILNKEI